jgi:hypothetical protein
MNELVFGISCLFMCLMALVAIVLMVTNLSRMTYPAKVDAEIKKAEAVEKIEKASTPVPPIRALTDEYEADNEHRWKN